MLKLKVGDEVMIGDSLLIVKRTKQFQVCLGIKAKKTTLIRKLP